MRLRFKSGLFQPTAFSRPGQASCTRLLVGAGPRRRLPGCRFAPAESRGAPLKTHTNYPRSFAATIKRLENRPSPSSSAVTGPIHFLFVDTLRLVSYQCGHCAWLSWGRAFYFPLAKLPSFFFLTVKAWWKKKKRFQQNGHRIAVWLGPAWLFASGAPVDSVRQGLNCVG